ncbi:MAG: hypothetical protein OHK0023_21020 [Anaerolineae bacterium]
MQESSGCLSQLMVTITLIAGILGFASPPPSDFQPPVIATAPVAITAEPPLLSTARLNPCTNAPFRTLLTNAAIAQAEARLDANLMQWSIHVTLDPTHPEAQAFAAFTAENIGQRAAIVLNKRILSVPLIQSKIEADAGLQISGTFSEAEATLLAAQIQETAAQLEFVDFSKPASCSVEMPAEGESIITDRP